MSLNTNTVLTLKNYCAKVYMLMGLDIYKMETIKEQWLCLAVYGTVLLEAELPSCQDKILSIPNKYSLKKP